MPEKCPQCGASLPAGALAGLCPACLLQQGAAADTATRPEAKTFVPPTVEEVARLFPQLEILGFLGKGGMGAVYKARQPALDRLVALKILPAQAAPDPGFADRFTREARALARLSHPNIVAVHEFGQVPQRSAGVPPAPGASGPESGGNAGETPAGAGGTPALPFFIMEFVDGVNLRQLQKAGRLSPREALQIVPQICDALQYAHDEGVVHRDIKPENVLVDRKGRVKIADFGLAKILGCDPEALRLTGEGQVMGTPHYMAPEQVEHPQDVDHRADIFSLGVVFYEMLTGELPLGKFQPPSRKVQVDVRLDEVVLHALEKEPERRYQQASQVKTDVEGILADRLPQGAGARQSSLAHEVTGSKPAAAGDPSRAGVLAWKLAALVIVAVVVVNCVIVVIALRPTASGPRPPRPQAASTPVPVVAVHAYKGDLGVHLSCIGTVESSNSVLFAIPSTYVQRVVKKLDAGEPLPIEAFDPSSNERFGHGSLLAADNRLDTASATLTCKGNLLPDGGNLMIPGLMLNIRVLLEVKHGLILVPTAAVQLDPEGTFVWVIRPDQTAGLRRVAIGAKEEQTAGIQDGLSPGELVVIESSYRLNEGRKVAYKLASGAEQRATTLPATPAALAKPPSLRFLAWQDEWKTNQLGAARHPDGSPVTNTTELDWLRHVQPSGMNVTGKLAESKPRFLHLWISHPAFDANSFNEIALLDGAGKPIQLGGGASVGIRVEEPNDHNGNLGWLTLSLSPGEGTNLPTSVTVRLCYTVGPLERVQELAVTPNRWISLSLEGGSALNGVGQNVDGRAFVAIAVNVKGMRGRRFAVIAVAKDGREFPSMGGGQSGTVGAGVGTASFDFDLPLADVAKFRIGTRPIRTNEWRDVVLPVSYNKVPGWTVRRTAVDTSGQLHESFPYGESVDDVATAEGRFTELPLSQVKEFRFEARPYTYVEFRHVSLEPGRQTPVEILDAQDQ